jgi:OOP family OmpA-OmpF porin
MDGLKSIINRSKMKKIIAILLSGITISYGQFEVDLNTAVEGVKKGSETMIDGVNKATEKRGKNERSNEQGNTQTKETNDQKPDSKTTNTDTQKITLKSYQNYDFVAGEKIIFEDNFLTDMDGEFPAHWELKQGQAVMNKVENELAFFITDGNYGKVNPRIKSEDYLGSEFTVEFDYYNYKPQDGPTSYGMVVILTNWVEEGFLHENSLYIGTNSVSYDGVSISLSKDYPAEWGGDEKFCNKFHHISIGVKNNQMKVYVDQNRILVVPDVKAEYQTIAFAGIASDESPIIFKNVKIAEGGKMNMLDKIMTDGKIITHGILFDVNKASIKPESMGVLNQIFQLLKDNADLKFEIGGYTDGDGDEASNLKLSEQRAIAVKTQLISMGIDAGRLTTKGYGESNPIDNNSTLEGKANNRRVVFTKQ